MRSSDDTVRATCVSDSAGVFAFALPPSGEQFWLEASDPTGLLVGTTLRNLTAT